MHFYAWRKGLKTGIYYLRTKPVAQAQQFTIEPEKRVNENSEVNIDNNLVNSDNLVSSKEQPLILACSRNNPDCEACGS